MEVPNGINQENMSIQPVIQLGDGIGINGKTSLHQAVEQGNCQSIKTLVESGVDINVTDLFGQTAVHTAAKFGQDRLIKPLVELGANVNCIDKLGHTALHNAVEEGWDRLIRTLVALGADINAAGAWGLTALHAAVKRLRYRSIRTLVKLGAVIDATDCHGQTALHVAATLDNERLIRLLVELGADINAADKVGRTPLHDAAGLEKVLSITTLVELGADINAIDVFGYTTLHSTVELAKVRSFRTLVELGVDINSIDNDGDTPLHTAVDQTSNDSTDINDAREIKTVRTLLELGADINATDANGQTALQRAASQDKERLVRTLAELGADINASNHYGNTALHCAASEGHGCLVDILVEFGANVNAINSNGCTALQNVIMKIFPKNGTPSTQILHKYDNTIKILMTHGANATNAIKTLNYYGVDVIYHAVEYGCQNLLKLILNECADVVIEEYNNALQGAVERCHKDCVDILLKKTGVSLNWKNHNGETLLHFMVRKNNIEAVKYLLTLPIDSSNETDTGGRTPLDLAKDGKHQDMLALLQKVKHRNPIVVSSSILSQFHCNTMALMKNVYPLAAMANQQNFGLVRKDTIEPITSKVKTVVKRISMSLTKLLEKDKSVMRLIGTTHVGSSNEGTKVGMPDEYDFLLVFDYEMAIATSDVCGLPIAAPGYCYLELPDSNKHTFTSNMKGYNLASGKLFSKWFWQQLEQILQVDGNLLANTNMSLKYKPNQGYLDGKVCSTITLTSNGTDHFGMDLTIDLTPSLKFNQPCPFINPDSSPPDHYYLIPKAPHKESIIGQVVECEVLDVLWRVDTLTESESLQQTHQNIQDAYVTCKCIRTLIPALILPATDQLTSAEKFVSSYMMKVILLKYEKEMLQKKLTLEQIVASAFEKLVLALETEYLPDYWDFATPYNITDDILEEENEDFSYYGYGNILAGSKFAIEHCLHVARLLKALALDILDKDAMIREALHSDGGCTLATLRVHEACYAGDISLAEKLLSCKANFRVGNKEGQTALHVACAGGHLHMVTWLVEHGLHPSMADNHGHNSWHYARINGHLKICQWLKEKNKCLVCSPLQQCIKMHSDQLDN